jgi:predicted dehydrogenase
MVEQLIHIADLARHSLGMPQTVYARAANLFHTGVERYTGEDVSGMLLGYGDGRIGVLHASNAAIPGRWMKQWQIVAERATGLFSDWNAAELVLTAGEVRSETVAGTTDPFVAQLVDVAEAIRNRRPPHVPLRDGLDTLRIVLAARRSADEGREVSL